MNNVTEVNQTQEQDVNQTNAHRTILKKSVMQHSMIDVSANVHVLGPVQLNIPPIGHPKPKKKTLIDKIGVFKRLDIDPEDFMKLDPAHQEENIRDVI